MNMQLLISVPHFLCFFLTRLLIPPAFSLELYSSMANKSTKMIRGVGLLRTVIGKDSGAAKAISKIVRDHALAAAQLPGGATSRATMVTDRNRVVLVEEWATSDKYDVYTETPIASGFESLVAPYVSEPPTREYFPEALHIGKGEANPKDIGILVRQKTSSPVNGSKLRDVQRAAYERQMGLEPGCTCCIILADSSEEIKIIELWRTMQDFMFHESSEWHAQGEEKVVPLVIDMDCDFVDGTRILC